MRTAALFSLILSAITFMTAQNQPSSSLPTLSQLQQMTNRFAPTRLDLDTSQLSAGDRQALAKLIEAGRLLDDVFMQQLWSGDAAMFKKLQQDKTPLGQARLRYFWIN